MVKANVMHERYSESKYWCRSQALPTEVAKYESRMWNK